MIQAGQLITDGTAVFIVDDIRDGNRVGDIVLRHTLREGYIKANGAVVTASDYPRLVQYVIDNNLTTTESDWQSGQYDKYVYDIDTDTLRVPNVIDRFLEGSDINATVVAGLPDITGSIYMGEMINCGANGAFYVQNSYTPNTYRNRGDGYNSNVVLNASRSSAIYGNSDTVQPPAIKLIAQIKY